MIGKISESFTTQINQISKPTNPVETIDNIVSSTLSNNQKASQLRSLRRENPNTLHYASFINKLAVVPTYSPEPSDEEIEISAFFLKKIFQDGYSKLPQKNNSPENTHLSVGSSNELTKVHFGGGLEFATDFFKGINDGYWCDRTQGIFVTLDNADPRYVNRTPHYAIKGAIPYGQTPSWTEFEIPEKDLKRVNRNPYEAVLSPENASNAINIQHTPFSTDNALFKSILKEHLPAAWMNRETNTFDYSGPAEEYCDNPELRPQIIKTLETYRKQIQN